MKLTVVLTTLLFVTLTWANNADDADDKKAPVTKLQIGVKKRVEGCTVKSRKGDTLHMQYRGKLEDGSEFDSSYSRNTPFVFVLGTGQVIKGWDQGLLGMCQGEKRRLTVPADMGYGARGAPPKIPPNAALYFDVELEKIERHGDL